MTATALQRDWRTPTEFPACPGSMGIDPLADYALNLVRNSVFSKNQYGESLTERVGQHDDVVAVVSRMSDTAVKPWALAKITVENAIFVHEALGTFFTMEGAINAFSTLLGVDPPYGETIDDFC